MNTATLDGFELDSAVDKVLGLPGTTWKGYATDWGVGGPIIERERIDIVFEDDVAPEIAVSAIWSFRNEPGSITCSGPTPLIAAMRVFVASRTTY